jgi:Flp pilus assembly protein TadD
MGRPMENDSPLSMQPRSAAGVDSVRGVASEEFLFHLYRGAELLQDARNHEAKEELEAALSLQPRDAKGQDLLAVVYFRLGMYPRAIQIYEELRREAPKEPTLLVNLSLCYLKTGQAQAAREALEEVVRGTPDHKRAWGYLGLAYERLADLDKAELAFERAGHTAMAKRVAQKRAEHDEAARRLPDAPIADPGEVRDAAELRATAAVAFQELDAGELSFALAEPAARRSESGTWRAVEIGAAVKTTSASVPPPPLVAPAAAPGGPAEVRAPRSFAATLKAATLALPDDEPIGMHPTGLVVIRPELDFAARLDAVRSYTGDLAAEVLLRQTRTQTSEPFGGLGAPLQRLRASGPIVLGPRASHRLVPVQIDGEVVFLREESVLGFDLRVTFENGRLSFAESDALHVVQFRGTGTIVLELLDPIVAVAVTPAKSVTARRESIVGWHGRILPRSVPMSEAPLGQRGLVTFAGDGALLLTGR